MKNHVIKICPKSEKTRFVALDGKDRSKILAEGETVEEVVEQMDAIGNKSFIMHWIPEKGVNYTFAAA